MKSTSLKSGIFVISLCLFFVGCSSNIPLRESPAEQEWQIKQLIKASSNSKSGPENLNQLGVMYLRSGQFLNAESIFMQAITRDRANSKSWFYYGLSNELMMRNDRAMEIYSQAPIISSESIYSQAMQGRLRILQEKTVGSMLADSSGSSFDLGSPNNTRYIVVPFSCEAARPDQVLFGDGFAAILSYNLGQLSDTDVVDPILTKRAIRIIQTNGINGPAETSKMLSRAFNANKVVYGSCSLSGNNGVSISLNVLDVNEETISTVELSGSLDQLPAFERSVMEGLLDELKIFLANRENRLPLTSMSVNTLTDFSSALEQEEESNLLRSLEMYDRILPLFPNFTLALTRKEIIESKILGAGESLSDLVDLVVKLESMVATPMLIMSRSAISGSSLRGESDLFPRNLPQGGVATLPLPPIPTGN